MTRGWLKSPIIALIDVFEFCLWTLGLRVSSEAFVASALLFLVSSGAFVVTSVLVLLMERAEAVPVWAGSFLRSALADSDLLLNGIFLSLDFGSLGATSSEAFVRRPWSRAGSVFAFFTRSFWTGSAQSKAEKSPKVSPKQSSLALEKSRGAGVLSRLGNSIVIRGFVDGDEILSLICIVAD